MKTFKTPKGTELPLISLKGKDYLQVAHRILWFREERPDWSIETEFVEQTEKFALAKATLKDPSGRIIATAHKHETFAGFSDHREKSETGAIGRALALIGFGTQFAQELDEGERIVDSPLDNKKAHPESAAVNYPPISNRAPGAEGLKPQSNLWADYVLKSGKNKGKTLKEVGIGKLKVYEIFINELIQKGEKLAKSVESDLKGIQEFALELNHKLNEAHKKELPFDINEDFPTFDSDDKIPF